MNAYNAGIKNNVEIVQCSSLKEFNDGKVEKTPEYHTPEVVLTDSSLQYYIFYENHGNYHVWKMHSFGIKFTKKTFY